MSILDTLITDRTEADRDALLSLYARPKEQWTQQEKDGFALAVSRGAYNASDMSRVQEAMEFLIQGMDRLGYLGPQINPPSVTDPDTGEMRGFWMPGDRPTSSDLRRYLDNVRAMRNYFQLPDDTPSVPMDMDNGLSIEDANNIEVIMLAVQDHLDRLESLIYYSGELYSGEV